VQQDQSPANPSVFSKAKPAAVPESCGRQRGEVSSALARLERLHASVPATRLPDRSRRSCSCGRQPGPPFYFFLAQIGGASASPASRLRSRHTRSISCPCLGSAHGQLQHAQRHEYPARADGSTSRWTKWPATLRRAAWQGTVPAHRHHASPADSRQSRIRRRGVLRSLPTYLDRPEKSAVMIAQDRCWLP